MKITFEIKTGEGDRLNVALDHFDVEILPDKAVEVLGEVKLYDVALLRLEGKKALSMKSLAQISEILYNFMEDNPQAMLYFYCDTHDNINYRESGTIKPQDYRSRLFSAMFERYMSLPDKRHYTNNRIYIDSGEEHFIHIICRDSHTDKADMLVEMLRDMGNK